MKVTHLTETTEHDLASSPLYHEAYVIGRQLNVLLEAEALTPAQVEELFAAAEETMSGQKGIGANRTTIGKIGAGAGAVVDQIKKLGNWAKTSTAGKASDKLFADAKGIIAGKLGKTEGGAQLLQKLDHYRQFWEKYPTSGKFMYGLLTVLTGYASAGMTGPILLGATKTADQMLQNKEFTTSIGQGVQTGGTAAAMVGAKTAAGAAVDAAAPVVKNIGQGISDLGTAAQAGANKLGSAISQGAQGFADTAKGLIPDANAADAATGGGGTVPPKPAVDPNAGGAVAPKPPATGSDAPPATGSDAPPATGSDAPPPAAGAGYKTVGGDELGKLAQANKTTTQAIIDANPELTKQLNPAMNGKDLKIGVDINIPKNTVPAGTDPFTGNKFFKMGESVMFKAGRGVLEGITVGYLAKSEMFDRVATLQKWTLNESLGRKSRPLYLSERGIDTLFDNVEKLWERDLEEKRRNDWGREANAEIGRAAGRLGMTGQEFVQQKPAAAAAMGIGGNTRTYSNYNSNPEPNRFPGSPKPQKGNPNWRSTKYTGQVGNKFMDKVEKGLSTAGAYAGNFYKQATTKVTKEALMRQWVELNRPGDVDTIGQLLARNGVPQEYIMSLFRTMGLPAPQNLTPAKTKFSDDEIIDAANAAMSGGPALTLAQKARLDAIRQRQGLGPVNAPVDDGSAASGSGGLNRADIDNLAGAMSNMSSGAPGTTQPSSSSGDGQITSATTMILPQIGRMIGTRYADDLITIIDLAMSALQRSSQVAYREKMAQFRGMSTGEQREKPQDIITGVKQKEEPPVDTAAAPAELGPSKVISGGGSEPPAATGTGPKNESRRVYGGRYIKESADAKIARDFEKFVMAME